ncbi:MAG: DUF4931 domain-containing protein [Candidatus Omnitrophica bacterium]|nr:DUF4931 domain-containing protein [Candidatus Omnitrophota bacterium]
MPELRKDPVIGRWVIIATERAKRPHDFTTSPEGPVEGECPFCEGKEEKTPPEIFAFRKPNTQRNKSGWEIRVVPSISPILRIEGELNRHGAGMYDVMNGIGAHEVIIETPQHIANIADLSEEQIAKVFFAYIERIIDLGRDLRFKYVLVFKNYGWNAGGGRVKHSRSQLMALPVNPKRVKEELLGAKTYFEFKDRCIFCDIIRQELDSGERIIIDSDGIIAFSPFASRFPFETWIIPKHHSADFINSKRQEVFALARIMKLVLSKIKKALNDPSYNYIIHTAPFRIPKKPGYWKTLDEDYHWHIEIIPRLTRVAGFEWGSGFYINPTPPEEAAKYLRELEIG